MASSSSTTSGKLGRFSGFWCLQRKEAAELEEKRKGEAQNASERKTPEHKHSHVPTIGDELHQLRCEAIRRDTGPDTTGDPLPNLRNVQLVVRNLLTQHLPHQHTKGIHINGLVVWLVLNQL